MRDVLVDTSVWSLAFRRSKLGEREFAEDHDFLSYQKYLPITLYEF